MSLLDGLERENLRRAAPLAERMRARTLGEFVGQEHILGPGRLLRRAVEADRLTSSIFYGPPGCGKTTLAHVIAQTTHSAFIRMNAVTSGVGDVRQALDSARERRALTGQGTYLLLDECHRWNKAQSDSILPAIEEGLIRFIGSTTENPMISMTPAIVSRCRVFAFRPLSEENVREVLARALRDPERGLGGMNVHIDEDALSHIVRVAGGDVRSALNALELAALTTPTGKDGIRITLSVAEESIQKPQIRCDETLYYDMLSAFCKSLRGSDSDAALFWFGRLTAAGADPRLLVRRLMVHASEDVGQANPVAQLQAAAAQALGFIGMPEARIPIAQAIIAVCESPKSNAVSAAVEAAMADAERGGYEPVPVHLRDTHYKGASALGHGEGYRYPHDFPGHYVRQRYAPLEAKGMPYYRPSEQGFEKEIRELRKARGFEDGPDV